MFAKPSIVVRIAVAKSIGILIGIW